jgi:hypothetical protein
VSVDKFYLLDAATPNTDTMPSDVTRIAGTNVGQADASPTGSAAGAFTVRDASELPGTSQVSAVLTAAANQNHQYGAFRRYVTRPLAGGQFMPGNPWPYTSPAWLGSLAIACSNLNTNMFIGLGISLWRPSSSAEFPLGHTTTADVPVSANTPIMAYSPPSNPEDSTITVDGDVLWFDIFSSFTQSMSTAYTQTFYYNGTTDDLATNCAAYVTPPVPVRMLGEGDSPEMMQGGRAS